MFKSVQTKQLRDSRCVANWTGSTRLLLLLSVYVVAFWEIVAPLATFRTFLVETLDPASKILFDWVVVAVVWKVGNSWLQLDLCFVLNGFV